MSWNCRGLGNPRIVHELSHLIQDKRPSIIFIMETKILKEHMERISSRIGSYHFFAISSMGRGVELAILWFEQVDLVLLISLVTMYM